MPETRHVWIPGQTGAFRRQSRGWDVASEGVPSSSASWVSVCPTLKPVPHSCHLLGRAVGFLISADTLFSSVE